MILVWLLLNLMKFTIFLALLFIHGPLVNAQAKPNVLFLAIDDLNDWIGCLVGHPQVKTPHLDKLAARGTLFTNAPVSYTHLTLPTIE